MTETGAVAAGSVQKSTLATTLVEPVKPRGNGDGNDLLDADAGGDVLDGGLGGDALVGGADKDRLVGEAADGNMPIAMKSIAVRPCLMGVGGQFYWKDHREMNLNLLCFEAESGLGPRQCSASGYRIGSGCRHDNKPGLLASRTAFGDFGCRVKFQQAGRRQSQGLCQTADIDQGNIALTSLDSAQVAARQTAVQSQAFL